MKAYTTMKRIISLVLFAVVFLSLGFSSCILTEAAGENIWVVSNIMTNADYADWTWGNSTKAPGAIPTGFYSEDYAALGNKTIHQDFIRRKTILNKVFSTSGYTHGYMVVYCDATFGADEYHNVRLSYYPSGANRTNTEYTLNPGWNLIGGAIPNNAQNKTIEKVEISRNENLSGSWTADVQNKTEIYINGFIMSNGELTQPVFSSCSMANGKTMVSEKLKSVVFRTDRVISIYDENSVTVTPDIPYTVSVGNEGLTVNFDPDNTPLEFETEYSITLNNIISQTGQTFAEYAVSFTTRGENDNILPEVAMLEPENGTRYMPDDVITLSASASDENGTIAYVEFYKNGELIENSRVTEPSDGKYIFLWENPPEDLTPHSVTAIACDNEGGTTESDAVSVWVYAYQSPEVELTLPEEIYRKIGSLDGEYLTVTGASSDLDGTVESISILIDGDEETVITSNTGRFSYTLTEFLEPGEHTITAVATDNDGYTGDVTAGIISKDIAKYHPAVMTESLKNIKNEAKWTFSGDAEILFEKERGLVISCEKGETGNAERTYKNPLNEDCWQVDFNMCFSDTLANRIISLNGTSAVEVVKFGADGYIYINKVNTDTKYSANAPLAICLVVNPISGSVGCFINGNQTGNLIPATGSLFANGVTLSISQSGTSAHETVISDYGIYKMQETDEELAVMLYGGSNTAVQDLDCVPRLMDYIDVRMSGGVQVDSLSGNVTLIDDLSGEQCVTEFKDGKILIAEKLKKNSRYTVRVSDDVHSLSGSSYAGDYRLSFKTDAVDVGVIREETGFTEEAISSDATSVTFNAKVYNNDSSLESVTIVCAVYDGNKMVLPLIQQVCPVTIGVQSLSPVVIPLDGVDIGSNTRIEAFIVNNMNTMLPVSDDVYVLK